MPGHKSPKVRYRSLGEVEAVHCRGFAVQHHVYSLMQDQVPPEERFYYTWHISEASAVAELRHFGLTGESCVIPIEETERYRRVRRVMAELRRVRKPTQQEASGPPPEDRSSSVVSSKPDAIPGRHRRSPGTGKSS